MSRIPALAVCLVASLSWACALFPGPGPALASDAYIRTDNNETGQGVLRQRGEECLVITPLHVVDNALQIEVTLADKHRYPAEMIESFPGDLSVLRIAAADSIPCKAGAYYANIPLDTLLASEKSGELRTMLADGSIRIVPVNIVGYDQFRAIHILPQDAAAPLAKGESGSPLYIGGRFAGVLLSVANNVGNVVRSDALAQTVALFFEDRTRRAPSVAPKKTEVSATEKALRKEMTGKEQEFGGIVAKSAAVEHTIKLEGNSPVRLSFIPTGDTEQFNLEILDSARWIVYQNKSRPLSGTDAARVPFTPPRSDVYSLFIIGTKGEGKYAFTVTPITTNARLRSPANTLHLGGGAAQGLIAQGAVAEYGVALEENSPVRLVLPSSEDRLRYSLDIVDVAGRSVYRDAARVHNVGDPTAIAFTPPKTGRYTIRLKGVEGEGAYGLQLLPIASNAQLRGEANVLAIGGAQAEGGIAQGAVAEYRLQLEALQAVRFYFSGAGDSGKYTIEIVDSAGGPVYLNPTRRYDGTESFVLPFAAPKTDIYTLRLTGTDGECRYAVGVRQGARKD
ncbi:trypsin-like peptidase domain-containing protein [Desulfobulbus sp.]|uniref:trypsin-like peptidase domain-containing protein n=1 Tax=Desulfobulbus sp. TaxID=895 RepID=UPI00286F5E2A|nr:trypsin-like peptidase domain-containing protein [Desulfobulbus sp.]